MDLGPSQFVFNAARLDLEAIETAARAAAASAASVVPANKLFGVSTDTTAKPNPGLAKLGALGSFVGGIVGMVAHFFLFGPKPDPGAKEDH